MDFYISGEDLTDIDGLGWGKTRVRGLDFSHLLTSSVESRSMQRGFSFKVLILIMAFLSSSGSGGRLAKILLLMYTHTSRLLL